MKNISTILNNKEWPPTKYDPAYVEGFSHWYCPENIKRIDDVLKSIQEISGANKCLDIGFGNPILLQRELRVFKECSGLYITLNTALGKGVSKSVIKEGNCYNIPSEPNHYDLISAYALLHIIPDIPAFYSEVFRVLKPGGCLYTDGDRNITITKIIRILRILQYRVIGDIDKLEYWRNILRPKDNYHQEGVDYAQLEMLLKKVGFKKVFITPWFSKNPEISKNIITRAFVKILIMFKIKYLFTHVQIIAIK